MPISIIPVSAVDQTYFQWSVYGSDQHGVAYSLSGDAPTKADAMLVIRNACKRYNIEIKEAVVRPAEGA